jgi:hypothetical protein
MGNFSFNKSPFDLELSEKLYQKESVKKRKTHFKNSLKPSKGKKRAQQQS